MAKSKLLPCKETGALANIAADFNFHAHTD
jgi:hypothetical protein